MNNSKFQDLLTEGYLISSQISVHSRRCPECHHPYQTYPFIINKAKYNIYYQNWLISDFRSSWVSRPRSRELADNLLVTRKTLTINNFKISNKNIVKFLQRCKCNNSRVIEYNL